LFENESRTHGRLQFRHGFDEPHTAIALLSTNYQEVDRRALPTGVDSQFSDLAVPMGSVQKHLLERISTEGGTQIGPIGAHRGFALGQIGPTTKCLAANLSQL
jgi:hypothetical protein